MNTSEEHKVGDLLYSGTYGFGYITAIKANVDKENDASDFIYLCTWIENNWGVNECYRDEFHVNGFKEQLRLLLEEQE